MPDELAIQLDARMMTRALELARAAAEDGEAPIGAVIFDPETGKVVGEGRNASIGETDPTAHAEIVALRAAAKAVGNYRLTGLSMCVTLEPCAMGAGAISHARIGKVIYAADDPKGGAVNNGVRFFEQPTCHWRPQVGAGLQAAAASDLLKSFFKQRRKDRAPPESF